MKKSELQEIIREEISKVLKEEPSTAAGNVDKGNALIEEAGERLSRGQDVTTEDLLKYMKKHDISPEDVQAAFKTHTKQYWKANEWEPEEVDVIRKIFDKSNKIRIGGFVDYDGKRFKKLGLNKWVEVSTYPYEMTKKEHIIDAEKYKRATTGKLAQKDPDWSRIFNNLYKDHLDIISKLSDKIYTDVEVGV